MSASMLPTGLLTSWASRALLGGQATCSQHSVQGQAGPSSGRRACAAHSPEEPSRMVGFAKDIAAGTAGGIAVVCVGHPFDTVKVLLQTQSSTNPQYSGAVDCAKKVVAESGFSGLYRGVQAPLVGQMFFRATLFFSVARSKEFFGAGPDNMLGYGLAGSAAWGLASLVESPIDFYKSQMQKQLILARADPSYKPQFTSMADCVKQSFKYNGFMGPFQGLGATVIRNLPAAGLYFYTFEQMKAQLARSAGLDKPSSQHLFIAGGTAGFMYWACFYPLDVIKSGMQTDVMDKSKRNFSSFLSTTQKLLADGGLARLYRGVSPCLLRAVPANAVMLFTVDKVRTMLG